VIDLEDGTHPIYTYGATMDEVLEKIERQNGNAQLALARRSASPAPQSSQQQPAAIPPRPRMTAEEVMQATQDLQNPAKAADAIVRLTADATGVDPRQVAMDNFKRLAQEWENETPEFYQHPGNRTLVGAAAGRKVGHQVGLITKDILTQCFNELLNSGQLFEMPPDGSQPQPSPTPSPFPAESQVQRTERPRRSAVTSYSTGIRGTQLRAAQTAQPRTLKYSASDIETMPLAKSRALLERKDPDYLASVAEYERSRMATAS
jgi:hypothetical protein